MADKALEPLGHLDSKTEGEKVGGVFSSQLKTFSMAAMSLVLLSERTQGQDIITSDNPVAIVSSDRGDHEKQSVYDLPFSVRDTDITSGVDATGVYNENSNNAPKIHTPNRLPSSEIHIPLVSTNIRDAIIECDLQDLNLRGAYTFGPSTTVGIGEIAEFQCILTFGDRRVGYAYLDISRFLHWSDRGSFTSLGGGKFIHQGTDRDRSEQIRPDIINFSHKREKVRYASYAYVSIEPASYGNRYSEGISAEIIGDGESLMNLNGMDVVTGSNTHINMRVTERYRSNRYPERDTTPQTKMFVQPINGLIPDWVWCEKDGKICFGDLTEPSICEIVMVCGRSRCTKKIYCLPEPPVKELQVIAPQEVHEGGDVGFRVIAHYGAGWTPRDVTHQCSITGKGINIQAGTMGKDLHLTARQVDHKKIETITVRFQQYEPERYRGRAGQDYRLCQLKNSMTSQSVSFTIQNTHNASEFISVVHTTPDGREQTEYIHRDDYDNVMKTRSARDNQGTDAVTSDTVSTAQITTNDIGVSDLAESTDRNIQYGEPVGDARLGIQINQEHIVAGTPVKATIWYQYKNYDPVDITETIGIQTDDQGVQASDGILYTGTSTQGDINIWSSTRYKGHNLSTPTISVSVLPLEVSLTTTSSMIEAGGSISLDLKVSMGSFTNEALHDKVQWHSSDGYIRDGKFYAPSNVIQDTPVTIGASFNYSGRIYSKQTVITVTAPIQTEFTGISQGIEQSSGQGAGEGDDNIITSDVRKQLSSVRSNFLDRMSSQEHFSRGLVSKQIRSSLPFADIAEEISLRAGAVMLLSQTDASQESNKEAISFLIGEASKLIDAMEAQLEDMDEIEAFLTSYETLFGPGVDVYDFLQAEGEFFEQAFMLALSTPGVQDDSVLYTNSEDAQSQPDIIMNEIKNDIDRLYPASNYAHTQISSEGRDIGVHKPSAYADFDLTWSVKYHTDGNTSNLSEYPATLSLSYTLFGKQHSLESITVVSEEHKHDVVNHIGDKMRPIYAIMDDILERKVTDFPEAIDDLIAAPLGIAQDMQNHSVNTTLFPSDQINKDIKTLDTPGKITSHRHDLGYTIYVHYKSDTNDTTINYPALIWIEMPLAGNNPPFRSEKIIVNNYDHKQAVANYFELAFMVWQGQMSALARDHSIDVFENASGNGFKITTERPNSQDEAIILGPDDYIDKATFTFGGKTTTITAWHNVEGDIWNYAGEHQCTHLIHRYATEVLGIEYITGWGDGHSVWNTMAKYSNNYLQSSLSDGSQTILERVEQNGISPPTLGSVISFKDTQKNEFGHVAIVTSESVTEKDDLGNPKKIVYYLFEQNHGYSNTVRVNREVVFEKTINGWEGRLNRSGIAVTGWINFSNK